MGTRRIALIQGHPDPFSRHYCHALAEAYMNGARAGGHTVDLMEVARLEFPLVRSREDALSIGGVGPIREPSIGRVESADDRKRRRWWSKVEEMGRKAR